AFSGAIHRAPCVAAKLQSNKGQRPSSRYHRRAERNCTGDEDGRGDIRRGSTAAAIRKERLYVYVDTPRVNPAGVIVNSGAVADSPPSEPTGLRSFTSRVRCPPSPSRLSAAAAISTTSRR